MSPHVRYAVRLANGGWSGASRYSYRAGKSTVGNTSFRYAKLFTQEATAQARAKQAHGEVVPVTVILPPPPEPAFTCPIKFPGCVRNCGGYGGCRG